MYLTFVAHSLAYIFVLPSIETKGKIRILLSMFHTHMKLTCVLPSTGERVLLLNVCCKDTNGDLGLNGSLSLFFPFQKSIGWVFFRCAYVTHINVVWVWRKTIVDSAWLQRLIFSQQHVLYIYRLKSPPLLCQHMASKTYTNPSNKHHNTTWKYALRDVMLALSQSVHQLANRPSIAMTNELPSTICILRTLNSF